jgi:hypothetical protein
MVEAQRLQRARLQHATRASVSVACGAHML